MITQFTDADCLALVERSPTAVAAHDKSAWLALFARDYIVEDPVGSAPHVAGHGPAERESLSRFYDTFIAPNTIRFHVDRDCVRGLSVMRDLTIEIAMSRRVVVHVPVHLLYELVVEAGALKIRRLAAHWELAPMLEQQKASGIAFLPTGILSAFRMLRYQGVAGVRGFQQALSSVGEEGKARVEQFARCFNEGDGQGLGALCAVSDCALSFSHDGTQLAPDALVAFGGEIHLSKLLAAGGVVTANVEYRGSGAPRQGVALFELDRGDLCITALTCYWSGS